MQERETVLLDNGELLVNVTDTEDLARVTAELSVGWTWEAQTGPTVVVDPETREATEWLVLIGARPREAEVAA